MRPKERIIPILDVIKEIWEANPQLRFGQLIGNTSINYYTEDDNDMIYHLCETYGLPFEEYAIWWTYWINGKSKLKYRKLNELETPHLLNIMDDYHVGRYKVNEITAVAIRKILSKRLDLKIIMDTISK